MINLRQAASCGSWLWSTRSSGSRPWLTRGSATAANSGPNPFNQNRTISWHRSMPRSNRRSSTFRSDGGNRTHQDDQPDYLRGRVEPLEQTSWLCLDLRGIGPI